MAFNAQSKLLAQLEGQVIRVPNLGPLLKPLSSGLSPNHPKLKPLIASWTDKMIHDSKARAIVAKADVPLYVSRWFPASTLARQETMALLSIWMFVWDDVLDSGDHGDHTSPSKTVRPFEQALVYAEHHLGLSNPPNEPPAPSAAFGLLQHSARTLREQVNADQRLRIFNQIKIYIECCQTEQKYRSRGVVPSEQEYWEYRRDTSTIPMWLSLAEYAADVTLPRVILETDEFSTLWKQVNRGGIIINDVLSLRKEMHENVINLVPVMMHASGQSIDSVMSLIIQQLEKCVQDIKGAGRALLGMVDNDPLLRAGLQRYIDQVESMVTGAYYWSLECDRYQVAQYKQEDGSLVIPLKCAPHQ